MKRKYNRSLVRFVSVFALACLILVNKCVTNVDAATVVKSQGYLVDDASCSVSSVMQMEHHSEDVMNGEGFANVDLSGFDLSYLEGKTYVVTVSGNVSRQYFMFSGCELVSDADSSMTLLVNGSESSSLPGSEGSFTFSYSSVDALESLQLCYDYNATVHSVYGGEASFSGEIVFSNLFLKISWQEDDLINTHIFAITQQPRNDYVSLGEYANFSVVAQGTGLTFQWQYLNNTVNKWTNSGLTGSKTSQVSVECTEKRNGQKYRCIITDASGNQIVSDAATLYLVDTNVEVMPPLDSEPPSSPVTGNFVNLMTAVISFMQYEFDFGGFSFSYWQVMVLSCLAGIVGYFLRGIFS